MIMKKVSKRTLFIFMSILLAQNCTLQAAAPAARGLTQIIVAAAKYATKEVAKFAAFAGSGYFYGVYENVKFNDLKIAQLPQEPAIKAIQKVPVVLAASLPQASTVLAASTIPATKIVIEKATQEVSKKASSWASYVPGLDYLKSYDFKKMAGDYSPTSKALLGYATAGCATLYIVKRLQLYYLQKKFLLCLEAAEATRDPAQWNECKNIMHAFSPEKYPIIANINNAMAMKFITTLKPSDISNRFLKYVFPLHTLTAYACDKMTSI